MTPSIGHVVIGPATHGVARYARALASELERRRSSCTGRRQVVMSMLDSTAEIPATLIECALVHLHVTDRLFGENAKDARKEFVSFIGRIGTKVSTTLHDLPQPSDGSGLDARIAFYRTVCKLSAGIVVSSKHEEILLNRYVDKKIRPTVIPLMVSAPASTRLRPGKFSARTVGVLGFIYPGKGHIETVRAMANLPTSAGFVALGTPSAGHEHLVDDLYAAASRMGRPCEVTGFLDDAEMRRRAAAVTVPVAFHRHVSASGSINTWIESGRRPLVPRTVYTEELDRRSPGVLLLHGNDVHSLAASIASSLADPSDTWIDPSVTPEPLPAAVAQAYDEAFTRWIQ